MGAERGPTYEIQWQDSLLRPAVVQYDTTISYVTVTYTWKQLHVPREKQDLVTAAVALLRELHSTCGTEAPFKPECVERSHRGLCQP